MKGLAEVVQHTKPTALDFTLVANLSTSEATRLASPFIVMASFAAQKLEVGIVMSGKWGFIASVRFGNQMRGSGLATRF